MTELFQNDFAARVRSAPTGVAHLPGSGPAMQTCADCAHFEQNTKRAKKSGTCQKAQALWRRAGKRVAAGKIPPTTSACSHFQKRQTSP